MLVARLLRIAAVQAAPVDIGEPFDRFAESAREVLRKHPDAQLIVYPELHLFGSVEEGREQLLRESAVPLESDLVRDLGELARELGVWFVPGSICERGENGELFNTALAFNPGGELVASYRKIFPWRPFEPYDPGDRFVVFDVEGVGRIGLSICYDSWFPELSRHLAWLGAELVVNVVKTTTPDRAQELVLARANSIVNQTFTVSVNAAGPPGKGRSIIVDPEGAVRVESIDAEPEVLVDTIDFDAVSRVRVAGTAGLNRMWSQFLPTDQSIALPLYDGRIDPSRWQPTTAHPEQE